MKLQQMLPVAILSLLLFSCTKKEEIDPTDVKYSGPIMVSFSNYQGYQSVNIDLANKWIPFDYEIKLTNTTGTAGSPITVKFVKDNNPIYEYNTANGTHLTAIPSSAYRFDTTNVVIPVGAKTAKVHFEINPSFLNLSNTYAFGLSIFSVSGAGATVSSNTVETSLVVELGTLNAFDGLYDKRSFFSHPTLPNYGGIYGAAAPLEVEMITSGASSVDSYVTSFYAYPTEVVVDWSAPAYTYFTGVNPRFNINTTNNTVTVTSSPVTAAPAGSQAVIEQTPADLTASKYYPNGISGFSTTKTIVAHFRWSVPTDRIARDTFVYTGPR